MTDKEKAAEISQTLYKKVTFQKVAHKSFRVGCAYKRGQIIANLEERKKGWEYSLNYGGDFAKGVLKAVNEILEMLNREDRENSISSNDRIALGLKPIKY